MPWITVGTAGKILAFCTPPTAHDTSELIPNEPLDAQEDAAAAPSRGSQAGPSLQPFADATIPPDVALRQRLQGQPPALLTLLFAPLRSFERASAAGRVDERLDAVLQLVRQGTVRAPNEWAPHIVAPDTTELVGRQVYTALCLRVNVLEAYCRGLRAKQAEQAVAYHRYRQRNSRASPAGPPLPGDEATPLDGCSYYAHLWLDAHLLLCCCIEAAGLCPDDNTPELCAMLDAYDPCASTCFHEGELPNLLDRVEACSFFGDAARGKDPLTYLFSKAVPHRCVVRDVIHIIETSCEKDNGIFYFFQAVIAASLLGVYKHVRHRPALFDRLRLYRFFFFVPPPPVARVIDDARRNRGVSLSRVAAFRRDFSLPGTVAHGFFANEEHCRHNILTNWLSAVYTRVNAPAAVFTTGGGRLAPRIASMVRGGGPSQNASKKRYLHQNTVVNVVREYLIFALTWLPHVYQELCMRTDWITWQHTVIDCMDAMRAAPPGQSILKDVSPALLPSKTLYQVEKVAFVKALANACATFLDNGRGTTEADGCELALDAAFPAAFDVLLRRMLAAYPSDVTDFEPVAVVPGPDATEADVRANYLTKGRFPLRLLYGTRNVIREYRAAASTYARSPSPALANGLVRFLSETSMYQLQLVHAFAQAVIDRSSMYAIPLPAHLARQQIRVLRERLNIDETDANQACPRHMLTSFVCRVCRKFRGSLVGHKIDGALVNEVPPFGSELVSFASSCIEHQTDDMLQGRQMPSWNDLRAQGAKHATLFAWYKANAGIDMDMRPYPPDPSVFSAAPDTLPAARIWFAGIDERAKDITFTPDTADPLPCKRVPAVPMPDHVPKLMEQVAERITEDDFMDQWTGRLGHRLIAGHWSPDPLDTCVIWTCASKYYKHEERKTRQTGFSQQKVQDAITERQRQGALRTANAKRRHDMRYYYKYSLCSRTRLMECNMLGWAVRVDKNLYVACCKCLGYTAMINTHWHGDSLLCTRCWQKTRAGAAMTLGVLGSGTAIKCRQCKRVQRPGEEYVSTTVLADQTMRFVAVFFCQDHVKKKSWLFTAPNYHSLSTVDLGIKAGWGTLRRWDSTRDYLRNVVGGSSSSGGGGQANTTSLADDDVDQALVRQVRMSMGGMAIDGDGDDNEADEDDVDGTQETSDEAKMAARLEQRARTPKARKTGTAKSRLASSLRGA